MVIEQIIQNGDIPTLSPKMRGPKIKPSNCCNAKMKRAVQIAGIIPYGYILSPITCVLEPFFYLYLIFSSNLAVDIYI